MQGLLIAILQAAGIVVTVADGKNLQNLLICLEMLPAALGMLVAFPYTEYKGSGEPPAFLFSALAAGWKDLQARPEAPLLPARITFVAVRCCKCQCCCAAAEGLSPPGVVVAAWSCLKPEIRHPQEYTAGL